MIFLLALLSTPLLAQQKVTLVRNGQSNFRIFHAPDAPSSVKLAAQELQHYVEKSTRVKLPMVASNEAPQTPVIALGDNAAARNAGLTAQKVPLEGFRIAARDGNVFILGPDTPDGQKTPQGGISTGTLNGVYTFLEDYLNIRWLMPGEMGEDVPTLAVVEIPNVNRLEGPGFLNRRLPYIQNAKPTVVTWQRRQKLGFSLRLEHSHNWHSVVPPALFETHPEWFAEIGSRRVAPVGDRYKLETTNPELVQHYARAAIETFRADPTRYTFSLSPTDSRNWSESAASKAFYDKDPHGKFSTTPLVLKFYNDVAKIVGQEFPDRKLAGYIYADYLYPPSAGVPPLEPNLFLVIAPSITYGYQLYRPSVQQDWDNILKAWSSQTSHIAYYDLPAWLRNNSGIITPPAPEILNFLFPHLVQYKIKGTYIYGNAAWSQAAVGNYALAKLMWNPKQDARSLCREFYRRAYGEVAAPCMQQIYELIDATVKDYYNKDLNASYSTTPAYMKSVLAANYPQVETLYLEASRAATAAKPEQRARLQLFGDNLALMQWQLRAFGFLPENKESPLYRTDEEIEAMVSRELTGFGFSLAPDLERAEREVTPLRVALVSALAAARPMTPFALRGATRILFFPTGDHEIQVTPTKVTALGDLSRYDVYDALGKKITGGILRPQNTIRFAASAHQVYYLEIGAANSFYELEIRGAPYALAANAEAQGLRFQGKATPLYFHVPATARQFTLTVRTSAPTETSLSHLYSPAGKLVQTLDTQTTPVARVTITPDMDAPDWEGYWCLSVEKAPTGVMDDVNVTLDSALSQWYVVNPAEPLWVSPLEKTKTAN